MKRILKCDFKSYYEYDALFFSQDCIVVDTNSSRPFVKFEKGLSCLSVKNSTVFLDGDVLIVILDGLEKGHGLSERTVKGYLTEVTEADLRVLLRATGWVSWYSRNQYCSRCGHVIQLVANESEKHCDTCGLSSYPSMSPAIMVLLKKGRQILLARSPHFRTGMYSALAGFVDIGESAEDALCREVNEEVGLRVQSIKYFGSQSWPFPSSFMMAFTAEYLSGDICIQEDEIEDARWFDVDRLPDIPADVSISGRLIRHVVSELNDLY